MDDEIDSFPASDESSSSGEWVSKVTDTRNERAVKCKMLIDKKEVIFQIDTGATCNLLPVRYANNLEDYCGTLTM